LRFTRTPLTSGWLVGLGSREVPTGVTTVGLIANPVSARDIRRVIANAGSLQAADRASIILRTLAALSECGVQRVLAMPDRKGLRTLVERGVERELHLGRRLPVLEFIDMPVTGTVVDTMHAAAVMADASVAAIVVLGGDGTHRAVVRSCAKVPVAGISTGTNNAYPEMREPTITGLATGLYAAGKLGDDEALRANKVLEVEINDGEKRDLALVDVVVSTDRCIGAKALWHVDHLRELFVSFANPEAIGMSSVAGLLEPVPRDAPAGLHVRLRPGSATAIIAPIGPGLLERVAVAAWERLEPDEPFAVPPQSGMLSLDGEREVEIGAGDRVTVTLRCDAFRSVDVSRCMQLAAQRRLLHRSLESSARPGEEMP
jgi:predicted polyphosphate/ATP-dependent NAD kinase